MKKLTLLIIVLMAGIFISVNLTGQNSNLANIDEFIIDQMETYSKPGLAACIIKGDSVVWRGNFGYAILEDSLVVSDTTVFGACSIGKSITAACVMQLWEDGLIDLDENINNFLPFQIDNPTFDPDSITARMLMTHTSGIRDFNLFGNLTIGDPLETLGFFLENYLSNTGIYYNNSNFNGYTPGTHYEYCNFGSALNGYLVEVLMGAEFKEYAVDNLLSPLGMNRTAWFLSGLNVENIAIGYDYSGGQYQSNPHYGHPAYPGFTLRSNAYELAQFAIMLLNHGNYSGNVILEPATVDSMTTLQLNPQIMGLGLQNTTLYCQNGQKILWGHAGCGDVGYAAELQFCPDENIGVIYMSNSSNFNDNILKRLFDYAAMIVIAEPAIEITNSEFTAICQSAPDATGYFLDVSEDESFSSVFGAYENFDIGIDTMYTINNLSSNTEYYYRLRAYNNYDTGAYSNTVKVTTLLGTDIMNNPTKTCTVWNSNKTIYIETTETIQNDGSATIYSLTGQLLGVFRLKTGFNSIKLNINRQPVLLNVNTGGKILRKKVMVW